jgi:hypothetical protein
MSEEFELKKIDPSAVKTAVERAEHYRLLNDPTQAESICLDILGVEPENQTAKRILILALTDQFADRASTSRVRLALEHARSLESEYEQIYYEALVHEREGRAYLAKGLASENAYECLRDAMDLYEKAGEHTPTGNPDPTLRWNSCVRTIKDHRLEPRTEHKVLMLE